MFLKTSTIPTKKIKNPKNRKCCFHSFERLHWQRKAMHRFRKQRQAHSVSVDCCASLTPHTAAATQAPTSSTGEHGQGQLNIKNKQAIVRCAAGDYPADEGTRTRDLGILYLKTSNSNPQHGIKCKHTMSA